MSDTENSERESNLAKIDELLSRQDSGGALSDEETAFLSRMADDPEYPVEATEYWDLEDGQIEAEASED